ncbi:MAG TPA: PQQ-binding-like beta-propeller repeat protein [Micropepsaceae bacterium]|nr:PQQ-binding-like beta-propeller repeat protein [Micropepsaceae bacterium]
MAGKATVRLVSAAIGAMSLTSAHAAAPSGEAVYGKYCASCHDQTGARIPARAALMKLSPAHILKTLDFGAMMSIAYPIRREEREAVAQFLGHGADDPPPPSSAFCKPDHGIMAGPANASWAGWSPDSSNARFQNAASAALNPAQVPKLELKWAYAFPGDVTAFGAPAIVRGTLFTGSAGGGVQALDAKAGCIHWLYQASGPVRSGMAVVNDGGRTILVFSDQNGWTHAVNAKTGKQIWRNRPEQHEATRLTGTPAEHDGVVFVPAASWEETRSLDPEYPCCTFRGSITAFRVRTGEQLWKTYLVDKPKRTGQTAAGTPTFGPSGAGVWSRPTVDAVRGLLYIASGDNYSHPATSTSDAVIALDIKTGHIVWSRQMTPADVYNSACGAKAVNCPSDNGPDFDFGSSPILIHAANGRDLLAAGQKSGMVYALDPDQHGKLLWQTRVGKGGTNGGVQWGMASDGRALYVAISDVVRLPAPAAGADASHPAGPIGNSALDPGKGGGLTALDLANGKKLWFAPPAACAPPRPGCSPAQPGAVTVIPGAVFSGSMDGHIRAFSAADGHLLWDFDTEKPFSAVNGATAHGGSLDGAGPVVVGGMVYVNSGYPRFGGAPGNVLLAFGPKE